MMQMHYDLFTYIYTARLQHIDLLTLGRVLMIKKINNEASIFIYRDLNVHEQCVS